MCSDYMCHFNSSLLGPYRHGCWLPQRCHGAAGWSERRSLQANPSTERSLPLHQDEALNTAPSSVQTLNCSFPLLSSSTDTTGRGKAMAQQRDKAKGSFPWSKLKGVLGQFPPRCCRDLRDLNVQKSWFVFPEKSRH